MVAFRYSTVTHVQCFFVIFLFCFFFSRLYVVNLTLGRILVDHVGHRPGKVLDVSEPGQMLAVSCREMKNTGSKRAISFAKRRVFFGGGEGDESACNGIYGIGQDRIV